RLGYSPASQPRSDAMDDVDSIDEMANAFASFADWDKAMDDSPAHKISGDSGMHALIVYLINTLETKRIEAEANALPFDEELAAAIASANGDIQDHQIDLVNTILSYKS